MVKINKIVHMSQWYEAVDENIIKSNILNSADYGGHTLTVD